MGNVESAEYEFGRFASELPDPQSPASQFSMLVNKCAQYLLVRTRNKSLRELVGFSEGIRVLVDFTIRVLVHVHNWIFVCRGVLVIGRGEFGQALGYFKDATAIRPDDLVVRSICYCERNISSFCLLRCTPYLYLWNVLWFTGSEQRSGVQCVRGRTARRVGAAGARNQCVYPDLRAYSTAELQCRRGGAVVGGRLSPRRRARQRRHTLRSGEQCGTRAEDGVRGDARVPFPRRYHQSGLRSQDFLTFYSHSPAAGCHQPEVLFIKSQLFHYNFIRIEFPYT